MSSRLEWNGDAAEVFVRGELLSTLMVIGQAGEDRAKQLVSIQGPPRSTGGNPPHMDTGNLHESITHEVDAGQMAARIGTDLDYGLYLEVGDVQDGGSALAAKAIMDVQANIDQILSGIGSSGPGTSFSARAVGLVKRGASRVARWFRK